MLAYRRHLKIDNPEKVLLSDLPVKAGQHVDILILVKENESDHNPAEIYTETQWDSLTAEERSEIETQYILNNPVLMSQIQHKSEWVNVSLTQLEVDI